MTSVAPCFKKPFEFFAARRASNFSLSENQACLKIWRSLLKVKSLQKKQKDLAHGIELSRKFF